MIQRIQSLFLLFAAALVGAFLALGDAWRSVAAGVYPWVTPVTLVLGGLVTLLALGAVFLYKDRPRQRQAIMAAQWLDLVLVLVLVVVMVLINMSDQIIWEAVAMQTAYITALLPVGAYVFLRLARRGVEKDIALVRSMDRLR
jgi:magnesium-transporting ATPase (P-type)